MNENIERVLAALDGFRMNDEMTYSAYSTLHDEISLLDDLLKEHEAVEPKTGHWIESKCLDECFWVCSECNFPSEAIAAPRLYKYCPNCGTKMTERW